MHKLKLPRRTYQKAHLHFTFRTDIPDHKQARISYIEGREGVEIAWPTVVVRNARIVKQRGKIVHFETTAGTVFFWDVTDKRLVTSFDAHII